MYRVPASGGAAVAQERTETGARRVVSVAFSGVQDVVYVALGVLLAATAAIMLVQGAADLARSGVSRMDTAAIVSILDRILLALMVVELLYTVQVSFRAHALVPEPFLLVALIAGVRRILVITAEFSAQAGVDEKAFRHVMWELALLTVLIVVLVGSLVVLKRNGTETQRSHHAKRRARDASPSTGRRGGRRRGRPSGPRASAGSLRAPGEPRPRPRPSGLPSEVVAARRRTANVSLRVRVPARGEARSAPRRARDPCAPRSIRPGFEREREVRA
jgi:uncharacterized membrane protein (DUF373 family)